MIKQHNLEDEYELLTSLKEDYEIILDQQKTELDGLNGEMMNKRSRIKDLVRFIDETRNEEKSSKEYQVFIFIGISKFWGIIFFKYAPPTAISML